MKLQEKVHKLFADIEATEKQKNMRNGESDAWGRWLSLPHNLLKQAAMEQKRKAAIL